MMHPIWKEIDFWEKAILESISREIREQNETIKMVDETEDERHLRIQTIIFAKLSTMQDDMISCHVPPSEVKKVVLRFCNTHALPQYQGDELTVSLGL